MAQILVRNLDGCHLACTVKGNRSLILAMLTRLFRLLTEKEYFTVAELHDAVTMSALISASDQCDVYSVTVLDVE